MRRVLLPYAVPGLLIAAFAVFLGFALVKLADIEQDMRVEATENMLWVIHQAHVEALRFEAEMSRASAGEGGTDVALRYDVLLSRLNLLADGPQYRYLAGLGLDAEFDAHWNAVLALDPIPRMAEGTEAQALEAIRSTIAPLNGFLGSAANAAMVSQWNDLGERLDIYREAVWQIIASIVAITAIGTFISVRLIGALRKVRRTADLERTLEQERTVSAYYRSFAAMISHQFRTPLAVIDSSMQRLMRRGHRVTASEIAERTTKARGAIKRLTRLVETTLDAARLDSGQVEARVEPHDLVNLVQAICERWKENAPEREVKVKAEDADLGGEIAVLCDPELIEHILSNLLTNADKYSPADTPIEIILAADQHEVTCSVRDRGIGIPADEMGRLFERFFRARTAKNTPGTGIGLNLARNLARLQGGDVKVTSVEGRGSIFTLHLMAAPQLVQQAAQ